jgi:hypothetical protein
MNESEAMRNRGLVGSVCLASVALLLAVPLPIRAAAGEDPLAIVREAQRRTSPPSQAYEGVLKSSDGNRVSEKRWQFTQLGSHGQARAVIRFVAPAEVKGVALLIVNHPDRDSDQWMWTPAIERDRRVAVQDRSTRVFGTDFSFEDLEERDVDQYTYALLDPDTVDGALCWKIQLTPRQSKSSQYVKSIAWIRQDNYAYVRVEGWGKDGLIRRQTFTNLRNIQGIWTALDQTITDIHKGSSTQLVLDRVQYNVAVRDEDFTLEAIRQ